MKALAAFIALTSSAIAGCGVSHGAVAEAPPRAPYEVTQPDRLRVRADLVPLLRVAPVTGTDVERMLHGFGRMTFAPNASHAIRPPFAALVERTLVRVGDEVRDGQPLVILRSGDIARMRSEALSLDRLLVGQRDALARLESLQTQGAASLAEVIEARTRVQSTRAQIAGLRSSLSAARATGGTGDTFTLRSSSNGHVLVRTVEPGERIDPSDAEPAFVIGDPSALVVHGSFPERDAPVLRNGSRCRFSIPSLGAEMFDGTISEVVGAVDRETHTATATCLPARPDPRVRAEMVARIEVETRGAGAVIAPRSAVLMRRDDRVVFVQAGPGELERRVVHVGSELGENLQVLDGLREGERIVVENAVLLDGELDMVL